MLLNSKRHIDRRGTEVNMIKFTVQNTQRLPKHKSAFFYYKTNVCYAFPVILFH